MYYDIYVLCKERSQRTIQRFLSKWGKNFVEAADEYEYPQYASNPEFVWHSAQLLIDKLIEEPDQAYSLYWINPDSDKCIRSAMSFFTSDEGLIVGLSSTLKSDPETILRELMESVDGQLGKIVVEQPAPDSIEIFGNMESHF